MLYEGFMIKSISSLLLISFVASSAFADTINSKEATTKAITEIFLKRNPDAIDKYVVENYIQHQPGLPNGRKPFKDYLTMFLKAFPDYQGEIENVVAEDDLVSFHFKWTGTHRGDFLGIKPTGKKITRRTADVLRMQGSQITEHWGVVDQTDMLKELGILKQLK